MQIFERLNLTIDYIEKHITAEIDYSDLAKIMLCSVYHYQRMFSFIAGVPLTEYIRRRRLTLAAFDLQNSEARIIEIASKYEYESPEAFTRAFKNFHGVTPMSVRNGGVTLKAYPPITFHLSIKGDKEMNYRIMELDSFEIIGVSEKVHTENPEIAKIWEKAFQVNLFERLWDLRKSERPIQGILGVLSGGDWGKNDYFTYTLGIISDIDAIDNMQKIHIPSCTWVVFEVEGSPDELLESWRKLYAEWLPTSNYDLADIPAIECYLPKEEYKNELWIPVTRKKD